MTTHNKILLRFNQIQCEELVEIHYFDGKFELCLTYLHKFKDDLYLHITNDND